MKTLPRESMPGADFKPVFAGRFAVDGIESNRGATCVADANGLRLADLYLRAFNSHTIARFRERTPHQVITALQGNDIGEYIRGELTELPADIVEIWPLAAATVTLQYGSNGLNIVCRAHTRMGEQINAIPGPPRVPMLFELEAQIPSHRLAEFVRCSNAEEIQTLADQMTRLEPMPNF